jgi:hypothetical protein
MSVEHDTASNDAPLFVLSCARSGSTLLRYILDTHPDVACPPEVDLGELCSKLTRLYSGISPQRLGQGQGSEHIDAQIRLFVDGTMGAYARARGKRRWCEKSPPNVLFADRLVTLFPGARFACLYRHCMDVVASCLETQGDWNAHAVRSDDPRANMRELVRYWIDRTERQLAFERSQPASCVRVTYERLVERPMEEARRLFEGLGLSFEETLLDRVFEVPHDDGRGDMKITFTSRIERSSVGRGWGIAKELLPEDLLPTANQILLELGYPGIGSGWGEGPCPFSLATEPNHGQQADSTTLASLFGGVVSQRLRAAGAVPEWLRLRYKFLFPDRPGTAWTVDLTGEQAHVIPEDGPADVVITANAEDVVAMARGRANPVAKFMSGDVRVEGNAGAAFVIARKCLTPADGE